MPRDGEMNGMLLACRGDLTVSQPGYLQGSRQCPNPILIGHVTKTVMTGREFTGSLALSKA